MGQTTMQKTDLSRSQRPIAVLLGGLLLFAGVVALFGWFASGAKEEKTPGIETVKKILARHPAPGIREQLLVNVVLRGDLDSAKLIVETGMDINAVRIEYKTHYGSKYETLLNQAIDNEEQKTILFLIDHGADVNAPGYGGKRPLRMAALHNNLPVLSYLLYKGADTNLEDADGTTPLLQAMDPAEVSLPSWDQSPGRAGWEMMKRALGIRAMVLKLLACGADPNHVNRQGTTAVREALRKGKKFESIVALMTLFGARSDRPGILPSNAQLIKHFEYMKENGITIKKGLVGAEKVRAYREAITKMVGREAGKKVMDEYRSPDERVRRAEEKNGSKQRRKAADRP